MSVTTITIKKGLSSTCITGAVKGKDSACQTKVGHQSPIWYSLTSGSMSWLFHLAGKYSGWRHAASQFSCFQLRGKLIQMTFISQFWYILNTVFNTTVQTKDFTVLWPFLKKYIEDLGGHRDLHPKLNWKRKPKQKTTNNNNNKPKSKPLELTLWEFFPYTYWFKLVHF